MKYLFIVTGLIATLSATRLERRRPGDKLYLYEDIVFGGKRWEVEPSIYCVTLQDEMRSQASSAKWSVQNGNNFYIEFYTDNDCTQNRKFWKADTQENDQPSNFVIDGINDAVNSIRLYHYTA